MSSATFPEDETKIVPRARRWHIAVFLLPAFLVYTAVMILPLVETLRLSLFNTVDGQSTFVGFGNFQVLFGEDRWAHDFWNALKNNTIFFAIHMLVQNPLGIALAAMLSIPKLRLAPFYRTAIFLPTLLSFVIVGFIWKLILSPIWGITPFFMDIVGLKSLFGPWLGKPGSALITVSLISVWQNVGIPMMLIYAALLNIPDEVIEAAECDGITGWAQFWKIKLPLVLPAIGMVSILTFVGNFNAFDPDLQHRAGRACRARWLHGHPWYAALPHLLRLPAPARRPLDGCNDRHRDVPDHPRRRVALPVCHSAAHPPLPVLRSPAMSKARMSPVRSGFVHLALAGYTDHRAVSRPADDLELVQGQERDLPLAAVAADDQKLQPDRLRDGAQAGRFRRLLPEQPDRDGRLDLLRSAVRGDGRLRTL